MDQYRRSHHTQELLAGQARVQAHQQLRPSSKQSCRRESSVVRIAGSLLVFVVLLGGSHAFWQLRYADMLSQVERLQAVNDEGASKGRFWVGAGLSADSTTNGAQHKTADQSAAGDGDTASSAGDLRLPEFLPDGTPIIHEKEIKALRHAEELVDVHASGGVQASVVENDSTAASHEQFGQELQTIVMQLLNSAQGVRTPSLNVSGASRFSEAQAQSIRAELVNTADLIAQSAVAQGLTATELSVHAARLRHAQAEYFEAREIQAERASLQHLAADRLQANEIDGVLSALRLAGDQWGVARLEAGGASSARIELDPQQYGVVCTPVLVGDMPTTLPQLQVFAREGYYEVVMQGAVPVEGMSLSEEGSMSLACEVCWIAIKRG